MRSAGQNFILFLKGMAMGAADVVPGVSGGTIALISGIYEELIESINKVNVGNIKLLFQGKIKSFWLAVNGPFLLVLIAGIILSFLSLAHLMTYLLDKHPLALWSFFFGLILASAWLIAKELKPIKWTHLLFMLLAAILAYYITTIAPTSSSNNLGYLFFCGMIALCAMILPGISGSFILLLLGAYSTVLSSVANLSANFKENVIILLSVALGGMTGLLLFSRLLNWLFKKHRKFTIAAMTGFLIGSLNKIWPWQHITSVYIKHPGEADEEVVTMAWTNVLPTEYDIPIIEGGKIISHQSQDPQLFAAITLCFLGLLSIFLLEKAGKSRSL